MEMIFCNTIMACERKSSCGTHILDHLAADGAGFAACQVTVVAVLQVDTNFLSSLHLEAVHSFPCLGNVDLVVVLHIFSLLLLTYIFVHLAFLERGTFRRKHFSFRNHSFAEKERNMIASFRKQLQKLENNNLQMK